MSREQKHLDLLDYARAVAILCVVAFHCLCATGAQIYWKLWARDLNVSPASLLVLPLNLGSLGVAIFFVISGFCIHLSFQQQGKKYSEFFVRRFFRIYPAYLAALLLFAFLLPSTTLNFSGALANESWKQLISHLLLVHNIWAGTYMGINPSFWSLAVEVQLYLLYPALLLLVDRFEWNRTLIVLGITESVIHIAKTAIVLHTVFAANIVGTGGFALSNAQLFIYGLGRSPLAFWFSWALGAAVAEHYLQNKIHPLARVSPMIWVGGIVVCFLVRPLFEFMFMMACLLTATVLSRRLADSAKRATDGRRWKFFGWIGVCSYSLYLFHEPILFAVPQGWVTPYGTLARLLFLGLIGLAVLLLSALSYLAIEAPCVKLGKQLIRILKTQTHRPALE